MRISIVLAMIVALGAMSCTRGSSPGSSDRKAVDLTDPEKLPTETATITHAPEVPPPIKRKSPARVKIELETKEVTTKLADGVEYTFWTFGGKVPGPFMRVRVGDYVDFTLNNHPTSKMPHNIDLHAVTGQGGGAEGSFTAPGKSSTFSFRALNPGLYIYHCATAPVGMHIANGMYGLILVEPEEGLPPVDKEFYVVQSEFYTKGKYGERGLQPFSMEKAIEEDADYVVFNGAVGALANDNAINADVGDKVRIFFGNGGPNLVSSFHVIGEIFDSVYVEGGTTPSQHNVQTTLVPAGGSSIVEFKVDIPATYILVDHSIFRAFNKGALGMLKVDGERNPLIYTGKTVDTVYLAEGGAVQSEPGQRETEPQAARSFDERMKFGESVYKQNCAACHQVSGKGVNGAFPPLAQSDYLMEDKERSIKVILAGLEGAITVNGQTYNSVMPALDLSDEDVANVLTYVRNTWGNKGEQVTPAEVRKVRGTIK